MVLHGFARLTTIQGDKHLPPVALESSCYLTVLQTFCCVSFVIACCVVVMVQTAQLKCIQ